MAKRPFPAEEKGILEEEGLLQEEEVFVDVPLPIASDKKAKVAFCFEEEDKDKYLLAYILRGDKYPQSYFVQLRVFTEEQVKFIFENPDIGDDEFDKDSEEDKFMKTIVNTIEKHKSGFGPENVGDRVIKLAMSYYFV